MLRMTLTSSALAALLMLTACDQPQDQRAQNGSSQIQPGQTDQAQNDRAPNDQTMGEQNQPSSSTMDQTAPMHTAGIPVNDVQNPKETLAKASVKDSKGEAIGEVKSVSLDAGGKLQSVSVGIGTRTVALKPEGMTYVQAENALVTPQSKDEIQKMP